MTRVLTIGLVIIALAAPAALADSPANSNEALLKRFYDEVAEKGNVAAVDELVARNFVEHEKFPGGLSPDREGLKDYFTMMHKAFPDLSCDVHFTMSDGDRVAAYATVSGTQKGEFMGMPPSGKKFSAHCVDIIRFADGKAVEHWGAFDAATMMQQLGAMPENMSMDHHMSGTKK